MPLGRINYVPSGSVAMSASQLAAHPKLVTPDLPATVAPISRAHAFRRLVSAYRGPLFRIRRSTDGLEQDCASVSDAIAFVGAATGTLVTWHDQSGNARHLSQPTAAAQPTLIQAGVLSTTGTRAAAVFDNTEDYMTSPAVGAFSAGAASYFAVLEQTALSTPGRAIFHEAGSFSRYVPMQHYTGGTFTQFGRDNTPTIYLPVAPAPETPVGFAIGIPKQLTAIDTGSVFRKRSNRAPLVDVAYTRAGTTTVSAFLLNGQGGTAPTAWWGGKIAELIEFRSAVSDTDRNAIETSQKLWFNL
ncbi:MULTISPECIES: hypothetical protein [unclassified Rathayibacter]|uniref:hypothetical protein n=1 Tax=unclassified Rathayibacter TaxID=2609250 RepID=UPI0006F927C3|nr:MULTISPECIES: hypothetical protein [unclassified Rathayibacter]KQQ00596.1 hypothetical protein ASF42_14675 [Rathayibacter sp. Leaf294]KQS10795.1 hypothetical protein ASG06_14675 [Rathayibacter sp. Leaf185]